MQIIAVQIKETFVSKAAKKESSGEMSSELMNALYMLTKAYGDQVKKKLPF